jgi:hypothetical protein
MGEPTEHIIAGDRLDRQAHRLLEGLARARAQPAQPAQERLKLGERLLDGCAVGRGGWQEAQRAAALRKGLADTGALWALRLSSTTTYPGRSVGTRCSAIYHSKVAVSIAPAISQGACTPSGVSAATSVVFVP